MVFQCLEIFQLFKYLPMNRITITEDLCGKEGQPTSLQNVTGNSFQSKVIINSIYRAVDDWYKSVLERCRYAGVPVGNLENDHPLYFSDILFGRMLKKQSHLLWISEKTLPDLGGSEEDDSSFGTINQFSRIFL